MIKKGNSKVIILAKYLLREALAGAILEFLRSFLSALYMAALYYAALRAISERYAMLATAGLTFYYFIVRVSGQGLHASDQAYRVDNVLAELPVSPITVFRLAWFVHSALASAMTLANFYVLQFALSALRAAPSCSPAVLALSALTSPTVSLFSALQGTVQYYIVNKFAPSVFRLFKSKKINVSYNFAARVLLNAATLLTFFLYSAAPIYYTYASMPWWAKPLALVNPQTFLIEAGRGGMDPAAAAAAIALSLCAYYVANEKLFERFVEARRSGRATM